MKKICILLSLCLILATLVGCPSGLSGTDPVPVVYVAGYFNGGTGDHAVYWKDDGISITPIELNTTEESRASDIFVDANGKVFVSGYYYDGSYQVAAYWIDDGSTVSRHNLHNTSDSNGTGLFVDAAGTVYVSGYSSNGALVPGDRYDFAVYWIDDGAVTEVVLHNSSAAKATGIIVNAGGDVYASGDISGPIAVYWADAGIPAKTELFAGISNANAIALDGTDVYVAGRYSAGVASFWTPSAWTDLTAVAGNAWGIVRYGGHTYTVGDYSVAGPGRRAAYWVGTVRKDLAGSLANTFGFGIYVFEGNVYAAGIQNSDNTSSGAGTGAVYWRNGILVDLSAGGGSRANAIFVR